MTYKNPRNALGLFSGFLMATSVVACGGSGGGDSGSDTALTPGSVTAAGATKCGVVNKGSLENPPAYETAEAVSVIAIHDSNLIEVDRGGSSSLVKLHGVGATTSFDNTAARSALTSVAATDTVYFFDAGCSADTHLGEATVGQLVTAGGRSFTEALIEGGMAGTIGDSGDCDESSLASCYRTLGAVDTSAVVNAQQVTNFLWKPRSDGGYNHGLLSILLNPCDVRVLVNGEEIPSFPTGNGRCTTVRSQKTGCAYGNNVKVEVFEQATGNPVYFGNLPYYTVAHGCDRTEYAGSATAVPVVSCVAAPTTVKYSPSMDECNGNAGVTLTGEYAGAFSAELRLQNGSSQLDAACSTSACSPYTPKAIIDGSGTQTVCFGAAGDANVMARVHHVSIAMSPTDSNPAKFCISDPSLPMN